MPRVSIQKARKSASAEELRRLLHELSSAAGLANWNQVVRCCENCARCEVRMKACRAVGLGGSDREVPILLRVARESDDSGVACEAIMALSAIHSYRATRPLMQIASTSPTRVLRDAAIVALGMLGDPRCRGFLCWALTEESSESGRALAAQSLGVFRGNRRIYRHLVSALK